MDLKRAIAPDLAAAIAGPYFHPILLVWLDWPGGTLRMHSGAGMITWDGHTWQGVGKFGAVDVPEESASGIPVEFSLSLTCDLPELAAYADAVIRQRAGAIYLGATTTAGGKDLIGAPTLMVSGTMDTLVLATSVDEATTDYTLTVGLTTGPGYRSSATIHHSHEDQSRHASTDTAGKRLVLATARAAKDLWPAP